MNRVAASIPDDVLKDALQSVTGEAAVLASDLGWDMPSPCGDCPFLRTSPFHQGVARSVPVYMAAITAGRFAHTCHKTDNRADCDGPRNWSSQTKHCVGALLMLLKTGDGKDLQLPLLRAAEAGKIDLAARTAQAKADPRVFTLKEMIRFYYGELQRRLGLIK